MKSFIVVASLVSELAGGQNDPPLVLSITKNTLRVKAFVRRPRCCFPHFLPLHELTSLVALFI